MNRLFICRSVMVGCFVVCAEDIILNAMAVRG